MGFDIRPNVSTLCDVQKLVGAVQWVRGTLGIPARLMKPFYDQLKGTDPNEPCTLTPEMASAWREILLSCMDAELTHFNPIWTLEVAMTCNEVGAAAVMGHALGARPEPLWWLFSVQPTQAFTSWLEVLATLLRKAQFMLV